MAGDDTPTPESRPAANAPGNVRSLADQRIRARAKAQEAKPLAVRLSKARIILPKNCPYEPVGHNGDWYYVIDAQHNLRAVKPDGIRRNMMASICDGSAWLQENYPRSRKGGGVNGIAIDNASDHLVRACHLMGTWTPDDSVRGRGAWRGEDGDLILHRGNHLVVGGKHMPTGRYDEFVYVQRPALPAISTERQLEGPNCAGAELLARLDTFAWTRSYLDSTLMLGWCCAAMVGGALDFRPHCWVTGEFQAGKSTLQLLLQCLFGHQGIISVTDTSAAGVWQAFQCDTLPVGLDELEAETDPRKAADTIKLARFGSSGGKILRGSATHAAESFVVRSCFCCSAILVPPMPSQDLSRFHVFSLMSHPSGVPTRPFSTDRLAVIGGALLRRLSDHFRRLVIEVIPAMREHMIEKYNFTRRSADLYATLFGAADVVMYDTLSLARLDALCDHRFMREILAEIDQEQTPEWMRSLYHLMTQRIDYRRPESPPVGELMAVIVRAMRSGAPQRGLFGDDDDALFAGDDEGKARDAHHRLLNIGIRIASLPVSRDSPRGGERALYAIVANQHSGLADMFRNTVWQTSSNAAGGGGWSRALRRKEGAYALPNPTRFREGVRARAWAIPIDDVFPSDDRRPTPDRPQDGESLRPVSQMH